jgi:hypothetical protein
VLQQNNVIAEQVIVTINRDADQYLTASVSRSSQIEAVSIALKVWCMGVLDSSIEFQRDKNSPTQTDLDKSQEFLFVEFDSTLEII